MANLNYDSFTESIRTVLKLRNKQDDAIVREIVEAAVRDLIEEFDSDIGSRTDFTIPLSQEEREDGCKVTRMYLPEDALYVRQIYIGDVLVEPVDVIDLPFWRDYRELSTRLTGLQAFIGRTECGTMYVEFAVPFCVDDCTTIRVDYRVHSSDISYIPESHKNLALYAAIYHYRNWYMLDDPAIQSKAEENYRRYLARMVSGQGNQVTNQKRPYEVEWKKLFRFVLEGSANDISSRYDIGS